MKTSTFLVSLINLLFFPGYIFSVIFSPAFLSSILPTDLVFEFLNTSTFLVSTTNLLFFPGYIFSVIFSPCLIKSLRKSQFGFIDDFDLIADVLSFVFFISKFIFRLFLNVIGAFRRFNLVPDVS